MVNKCDVPRGWPLVKGDYVVGDPQSCVAVATCGSDFALQAVNAGAAISGPIKTANIGIEMIVANVIANPNIRFLIVAGLEVKGHLPGDALLCLHKYGISDGKIANAAGPMPCLENAMAGEVERFRQQLQVVDMVNCDDTRKIEKTITDCIAKDPGAYPGGPVLSNVKSAGVMTSTGFWIKHRV